MIREQLVCECSSICLCGGRRPFLAEKIDNAVLSELLVELDDRLQLRDDFVEFALPATDLLNLTGQLVQFILIDSGEFVEFFGEFGLFRFERSDTLLFGFEVVGNILKL